MKSRKITKTLSVISGLLVGLIAITTLLYFGLNRVKEPEIPVEVEPEPPACEVRDHVKVYLAIDEYYTLDDALLHFFYQKDNICYIIIFSDF